MPLVGVGVAVVVADVVVVVVDSMEDWISFLREKFRSFCMVIVSLNLSQRDILSITLESKDLCLRGRYANN